jgi:hypothetical protein
MLPAAFGYDVREGLIDGVFSKKTSFIFAEKDKKAADGIAQFIDKLGLDARLHYSPSGLRVMSLQDFIREPIDFVDLDTCNFPSDMIIAWLAREFLGAKPGTFDHAPFMAFNFCLNTRALRLPFVEEISQFSIEDLDNIELFGAADLIEAMKWGPTARSFYRAICAIIPGHIISSKAVIYLSQETPMMTMMFHVHHDSVVARQKLFHLTDVVGLDINNPQPLPARSEITDEKPVETSTTVTTRKTRSQGKPVSDKKTDQKIELRANAHTGQPQITVIMNTEAINKLMVGQVKSQLSMEFGFCHGALGLALKKGRTSPLMAKRLLEKFGVTNPNELFTGIDIRGNEMYSHIKTVEQVLELV